MMIGRIFLGSIILLYLSGCATASKPLNKNNMLREGEGVLIFSTIEEESDRKYESTALRVANAIATLGLYELQNNYQLHFSKFDKDSKSLEDVNVFKGSKLYVEHSFKSKEIATAKKWHVLSLESGIYALNKVTYDKHNDNRITQFFHGAITFEIKPGETTYLGNLILGQKEAWMRDNRGFYTQKGAPIIAEHAWEFEETQLELSNYPNYPQKLNKANIEISSFTK